jgi:hypothetical protein
LDEFVCHNSEVLSIGVVVLLGCGCVSGIPSLLNIAVQEPVLSNSGDEAVETLEGLGKLAERLDVLVDDISASLNGFGNKLDGLSEVNEAVSDSLSVSLPEIDNSLVDEVNDVFRLSSALDKVGHLLLEETDGDSSNGVSELLEAHAEFGLSGGISNKGESGSVSH